MKWLTSILLILISSQLSACYVYFTGPKGTPTKKVESFLSEGDNEKAVAEYLRHIDQRLIDPSRPEKENPYFYYLLIGDIYLQNDKIDDAKKYYLLAKDKLVSRLLVIDRLRRVGEWYEEKGQYDEAIEFLKTYSDLDPLIFDLDLDRIHKQMLKEEDTFKIETP